MAQGGLFPKPVALCIGFPEPESGVDSVPETQL